MSSAASGNHALEAGTTPMFREVQRFRHWFFWLPILIVTVVIWYQFGLQIIVGRPPGTEPIPDWAAWVLTLIFGIGFPIFAAIVRLVTEVRPGTLSIRLVPFRARAISTGEIKSAEAREYSPMGEFGGWGIRLGRDGGRAYNAYGTRGVQLVLSEGKRVLVGTQREDELIAALRLAGGKV
jgi:Family of unknown function (DUF6141)